MNNGSLSAFADSILTVIPTIMREFLQSQVKEASMGRITFPQFFVMDYLKRQGEARMKDLSIFMSVTMATMTGIVDRLVRDGYLRRVFDPSDRRIIKVALTAKGEGLAAKIHATRRKTLMNIFGRISVQDRENYLRIIQKVRDALEANKVKAGSA